MRFLSKALVIILAAVSLNTLAAPWVNLDDTRARMAWHALATDEALQSVWPLSWGRVESVLAHSADCAACTLPSGYLDFELTRVRNQAATAESHLRLGNGRQPFASADWGAQPENAAMARADAQAGRFSLTLALSHEKDSLRDQTVWSARNTQMTLLADNWVIGGGWVPRHWGSSWATPVGLSEHGSDFPSLFIERYRTSPAPGWLSVLGPWHLVAFAGQLEGDRAVPHAKVLGARFTFRPHNTVEAGLYRLAQWGGEGRPTTLSSLWDLALGRDNVGSDGVTAGNEPGNQVGGMDLTFHLPARTRLFLQVQGEDESNGLPSHTIGLMELAHTRPMGASWLDVAMTLVDTRVFSSERGARLYNTAYNHSVYTSGLRYHGRALGAVWDNDAEVAEMKLHWWREDGTLWGLRWGHYRLNVDGRYRAASPGGEYARVTGDYLGLYLDGYWQAINYRLSWDGLTEAPQQARERYKNHTLGLALTWRW